MVERLKKQIDFILEIDKIKEVYRQTYISSGNRKENDAEHSWHMALMAYLLKDYANANVDMLKVIIMILIHDIVEIDAGDTYAYDEKGHASKEEREGLAAERIFGLLPKEQAEEFKDIWYEYEEYKTDEAKYAHMLDNLQPILLNDVTDGRSWREHKVRREQVCNRNKRTHEGSEVLADYVKKVIDKNTEKGNLLDI